MATYSTTVKQFIQTGTENADFRAIIAIFRAAFTAFGWVQTSDTGQINPSTVNFPGANNTDAGYEMWRFNDSLQSSYPVYIKVQYGRGNGANVWRYYHSVSMSVPNGAGVFASGVESGTMFSGSGGWSDYSLAGTRTQSDGTLYRVQGSGDTNRGVISFFHDAPTSPLGRVWFLERTKNADGTDNGDGVVGGLYVNQNYANGNSGNLVFDRRAVAYAAAYNSNNVNRYLDFVGINTQAGGGFGNYGPSVRSSADTAATLSLGKVYVYPMFAKRAGWRYPFTSILACSRYEFPNDYSTVTIPIYGSNHTYLPLGDYAGDSGTGGFLIRYE